MKNIVVDIDGVICEYDFPDLIKRHFGISILPEWIWCYTLEDCLGLSPDQVGDLFALEGFAKPKFIKGAFEALSRLVIEDFNVCILSNRLTYMSKADLSLWLQEYNIPHSQIITCEELPSYVHYAIDDRPKKLLEIDSKVNVGKLLLFEQPWNWRCHDLLGKFTWVKNWEDIMEVIHGY